MTRTLAVGFGFQALVVLSAWLLARSLDLELAFAPLAVALTPVLVVSMLPLSIGGFGVREGAYVVLLSYTGLGSTDATLLSLLSAASFAIASLPGALLLIGRPRPASAAAPEADQAQ